MLILSTLFRGEKRTLREIERFCASCDLEDQVEQAAVESFWRKQQSIQPEFMLAHRGDQMAGFITTHREHMGFLIRSILVHPEHRRQGVGTALVRAVKSSAYVIRKRVAIQVPENLTGLQLLLRQQGFCAKKWNLNDQYGLELCGGGGLYYFFEWES